MPENLPTAGKYVDDELKGLFIETIDQLISDLGRPVKIFFEPTASGCPNCFALPDGTSNRNYDSSNPFGLGRLHKPFPNGNTCPICKGSHKILTENSITYTATISRAPRNVDFSALGIDPQNTYKTKMQLVAFEDIKRSTKALIDGEYCVRIQDPVKTGLKKLAYCRCFWKKLV